MMNGTRTSGAVMIGWLVAGLLLCAAAVRAGAATDVRQALNEMDDLEKQIERMQQQRMDEAKRLLRAGETLNAVGASLDTKTRQGEEGRQYLESVEARARRDLSGIQTEIDAGRQQVEEARRGARLAGAALRAEAGAADASTAQWLALALLRNTYGDRAQVGAGRIARLEEERADLGQKRERVQSTARYHSAFSEYGLRQLRQRHEALARQVAELRGQAGQQSQTMEQLEGRREELRRLLVMLAAKEASRVAQATPTPVATPTTAATPMPEATPPPQVQAGVAMPEAQVAVATPEARTRTLPAPAVSSEALEPRPPKDVATVAEVPYEEGNPAMVSQSVASDAVAPGGASEDKAGKAGTRYLFWRARPVGVRALGAGRVIFAGPFAGYRHLLIIDHGGEWRTLYGNLVVCRAAEGQQVQAGQTVGQYQAERDARAEPLWIEVRQGVSAVEPETWPALPADWTRRLFARLQD